MTYATSSHRFTVNSDKGKVSALLQTTTQPAIARLILGHGAGANMHHSHMQALADALANAGIETLRYHFPYMEAGGGRTDNLGNCLDTIAGALKLSKQLDNTVPTILAGHSFGGRMSSHFAAEHPSQDFIGLIYFSFPLHPAGKPATKRAEHLAVIQVPQLFLSGDRDKLAELDLLQPVVNGLGTATLHLLETADHSYKILKRTRESSEDVYTEAARIAAEFIRAQILK